MSRLILSRTAVLLGATLFCACDTNFFENVRVVGRQRPSVADGGGELVSWGRFAAGLAVPECPEPSLVVNTTADELDTGPSIDDPSLAGARLSLTEALWLANNRPGPDTIRFDAAVFPPSAPGVIVFDGSHQLPVRPGQVCIDGRARGVIVDWAPTANTIWALESGSLMVGLELHHQPRELTIDSSQVAGCRLGTDGVTALFGRSTYESAILVQGSGTQGGTLGPGNAIAPMRADGVAVNLAGVGARVEDNFFGFDPVTGAGFEGGTIKAETGLVGSITGNRVNLSRLPLDIRNCIFCTEPSAQGFISRNTFENRLGRCLLSFSQAQTLQFGPDNIVDCALVVHRPTSVFRLTRNQLQVGGLSVPVGYPAPPTLTSADGSQLRGECPAEGLIEIFLIEVYSDERKTMFQGEVHCDRGGSFTAAMTLRRGMLALATFTDSQGRTSGFSPHINVQ